MKYAIGSVYKESGDTRGHYLGKYKDRFYIYSESRGKIINLGKLPEKPIEVSNQGVEFLKKMLPLRGERFIGVDEVEYIFISPNPNNPIEIHLYDSERNLLRTAAPFIKEVLTGQIDEVTSNEMDIISSKSKLFPQSTLDLVKIGLTTFKKDYADFDSYEIVEIGNIVSGTGYYHEVDEYFPLKGILIKYKTTLTVENELEEYNGIGFFGIEVKDKYINKFYPFTFDESNSEDFSKTTYISNGYGDHVEISKELISRDVIKKEIENLNLDFYQKKGKL